MYLTSRQWSIVALILLAPLLASIALMPTLHIDTAETIMWGRYLPLLGTHKHPPAMAWFGAMIDFGPATAPWQALLLQLLLSLGMVFYIFRIGQMMMGPARLHILIFSLLVSLLLTLWPLAGYALNADLVPLPFWAGATYHLMAAAELEARRWHWPLAALMLALAFLTKYFAVLLAAGLFGASLIVPYYRQQWKKLWPYLTLALAALLVAPHLWWVFKNSDRMAFMANRLALDGAMPDGGAMASLFNLAAGFIVLGVPALPLISIEVLLRNKGRLENFKTLVATPQRAFVSWFFALVLVFAIVPISWGVFYQLRFSAPLFGLSSLLWVLLLPIKEGEKSDGLVNRYGWIALGVWGFVYALMMLIYGVFSSHNYAQEPAKLLTEQLKAEWQSRFQCGPAYIIGDTRPSQIVAVYYGRPVMGVPFTDRDVIVWYNKAEEEAKGAIFVAWQNEGIADMRAHLPHGETIREISLPRVHTLAGHTQTYWVGFKGPKGC